MPAVIVIEIVRKDAPDVSLAEHDDIVETLAADAADHPLD
jgi:hypothetical protein